jgi:hypothetical protein
MYMHCWAVHVLLVCEQALVSGSSSSSSGKKTSTADDLNLPSPPANLSLNQQQEYLKLKRKLALHEKKKLEDHFVNFKSGLVSTKSGKVVTSAKPPLPSGRNSPSSRSTPADSRCNSPLSLTASDASGVATASQRGKSAEVAGKERGALVLECERKIAATAERLKGSKAEEEEEQQRITALTVQLTECVSEIVKHEQVMVKVQQQLALLRREQEVCVLIGSKVIAPQARCC